MDNKIKRISMKFSDQSGKGDLQYEVTDLTGEGLRELDLPFDTNATTPENFHMEIFDDQNNRVELDWPFFDFLRKEDSTDMSEPANRKFSDLKKKSPILQGLKSSFWKIDKYKGQKFPVLTYADITERDMFGSNELTEQELGSSNCGVWGWSGLRKLEMRVADMHVNRKAEGFEQKGILYWNKVDSQPMEFIFDEHIVYHGSETEDNKKDKDIYFAYCDTEQLGEAIKNYSESAAPIFEGRFELHFSDKQRKEAWAFPVRLCVLDSSLKRLVDENQFVSLDFGTSSTCAAYEKDGTNLLLRLSGTNKSEADREDLLSANEYENPTNLMIYNWKELWEQWNSNNSGQPLFVTKFEDMADAVADYDSGYAVEEVYQNTANEGGSRKMGAILSELKTIPYFLSRKKEIKFTPVNDASRPIVYVTDNNEENEFRFNPIKFYGYLIGRVINQPRENRCFTKFKVTYPVKFQKEIKDKIRDSLGAGILRSLPAPIRAGLKPEDCVEMEYQESVACIGSFIPEQLTLDEDSENMEIFSVFDLGGGTWDTSYAVLRLPLTDEERERAFAFITILHTGGDEKMGAERLLHRLAFKLYTLNQQIMIENGIPFILPDGETMPRDINQKFLPEHGSPVADANVHALVEQIARPYFQAPDGSVAEIFKDKEQDGVKVVSGTELELSLQDFEQKEKKITLKVDAEFEDYLVSDIITDLIKRYKNEMEQAIEDKGTLLEEYGLKEPGEKFDLSKVKIFLGGNASRQRYIERKMKEVFARENAGEADAEPRVNLIQRIGDHDQDSNLNQRVTAKTAVAIGQLKFRGIEVDYSAVRRHGQETIMEYNVGFKNPFNNKFKPVLKRSDSGSEWKKANILVSNDFTDLFFTSSSADQIKKEELTLLKVKLPVEDPKKKTLFIRQYPYLNNAIEYRLGGVNDQFSPEEPYDENSVLILEEKK